MKGLKLESPKDIRELIRQWIAEVCEMKKLPFDRDGGTVVQLLNCWLRSFEAEKMSALERRIEALEQKKQEKQQ